MKRLDLGDIGNLAEAIAAIGVIVSLIYLGVQIQQNTNAIKATSYQNVAENITEFNMLMAQNEDLARIYRQGIENPNQLTPDEKMRFEYFLGVLFAKFDTAVELYERGMIDDEMMIPYTRLIKSQFYFRGVVEYWENAQQFFSDDLRGYIGDLREE